MKKKKTKKKNKNKKKSRSQIIKDKARKTIPKNKIKKGKKNYVLDTSAIINQILPDLIEEGLKGKLIIPNAVMAEMEKLANYGKEPGFRGLEEVIQLRGEDKVKIEFKGDRPTKMQINHAKSGEIDALIRDIANKNNATLITADLVQAKSAQAYGIETLFFKPEPEEKDNEDSIEEKGFFKLIKDFFRVSSN